MSKVQCPKSNVKSPISKVAVGFSVIPQVRDVQLTLDIGRWTLDSQITFGIGLNSRKFSC